MDPPSTAAVADACLRLGIPSPSMPTGLRATLPRRIAGPVVPARHTGSVDVFLEALQNAPAGGVLVVDNSGRRDEGCVGDLTAQACRDRGVVAMLVWGCHRDSRDLAAMHFPVWSLGSCPFGPRRLDARRPDALERAEVGEASASAADWVYLDEDGIAIVPATARVQVEATARQIMESEARQAQLARQGQPIAQQLDLAGYLAARKVEPELTFREHLRRIGGAIEV